jgi:hypothetical protein
MKGRQIWIRFATWILLALEFALAADLVRTAVAPTWDDIAKLAVIATIRTMLNYFLAKDIAEFDSVQKSVANPPSDAVKTVKFPALFIGPLRRNMFEWPIDIVALERRGEKCAWEAIRHVGGQGREQPARPIQR